MDIEAQRYRRASPYRRALYHTGRVLYQTATGGNQLGQIFHSALSKGMKRALSNGGSRSVSRGRKRTRSNSAQRSQSRVVRVSSAPPASSMSRRGTSTSRGRSRSTSRYSMGSSRGSAGSASWGGTGYAGRFKKATYKGANYDTQYLRYGAHLELETNGSTADINCVYVGHTNLPIYRAGQTICAAILRKLSQEMEFEITDPNAGLAWLTGATVIARGRNEGVGVNVDVWTYSAGVTTLQLLAEAMWLGIKGLYEQQQVVNTVADIGLNNLIVSYATDASKNKVLDLTQLIIKLKTSSVLKIQNRTKGVTEDIDAEAVDNQPLVGKLYHINDAQPKFQTSSNNVAFPLDQTDGLVSVVAASNVFLREPPHPKMFKASKATNVIVDPGQIKYQRLNGYFSGTLDTLLGKMCSTSSLTNSYKGKLGSCKLYALERIIGGSLTSPIEIAYEVETDIKAMCSYKKRPCIAQMNYT